MDPTSNLEEQLRLAKLLTSTEPSENDAIRGARLAELVIALNEWIRKGGFLPRQWPDNERDRHERGE